MVQKSTQLKNLEGRVLFTLLSLTQHTQSRRRDIKTTQSGWQCLLHDKFAWGDINKCLVTPDLSKESTNVHLG